MHRVQILLTGVLALLSCTEEAPGHKPRERLGGSREPSFPARFEVGSDECWSCTIDPRAGCSMRVRYGCPDGEGTCGREIPCDPSCCELGPGEIVGLDAPPWGPFVTAAQQDPRPPGGTLAIVHEANLTLLRPALEIERAWPQLRLPEPVHAWAWSSSDAALVVSVASRDRELRRVDASRKLQPLDGLSAARGVFDLSPDGRRLATVIASGEASHAGTDALLLAERGGESTTWPLGRGIVRDPVWAPDGRHIALRLHLGSVPRIRVVDIEQRTIVDSSRALGELLQPAWHPSGQFLAAWQHTEQYQCALRLVAADGQRMAESAVLESDPCPAIAFSPDGRHLAFAVLPEERSVATVKLVALADLQRATTITQWAGLGQLRWLDDAAAQTLSSWAGRSPIAAEPLATATTSTALPRAGLIAFVDDIDGLPQIHVVDPRGAKPRILTALASGARGPAWSPDGRALAFVTADAQQLRVLDVADDVVYAPRTLDGKHGPPTWSPTGYALAAVVRDQPEPHHVMTVWIWRFLDDHWGSVAQSSSRLPGLLDAAPLWTADGMFAVGPHGAEPYEVFEQLTREQSSKLTAVGEWLPRMIAVQADPASPRLAAWVGAAGHYELAWAYDDDVGERWQATGLRYDAIAAAADVAEPSPIAFAPDGSAFAFARPDPEAGGVTIEVAPTAAPTQAKVIARSAAGHSQVSWSSPHTTELLARAELPRRGAAPVPKRRKQQPEFGRDLNVILVSCLRAHPVELGTKVYLKTTSIGETGAITEAEITGELAGSKFASCVERGVKLRGFDPFAEPSYTFTQQFRIESYGAGSGL